MMVDGDKCCSNRGDTLTYLRFSHNFTRLDVPLKKWIPCAQYSMLDHTNRNNNNKSSSNDSEQQQQQEQKRQHHHQCPHVHQILCTWHPFLSSEQSCRSMVRLTRLTDSLESDAVNCCTTTMNKNTTTITTTTTAAANAIKNISYDFDHCSLNLHDNGTHHRNCTNKLPGSFGFHLHLANIKRPLQIADGITNLTTTREAAYNKSTSFVGDVLHNRNEYKYCHYLNTRSKRTDRILGKKSFAKAMNFRFTRSWETIDLSNQWMMTSQYDPILSSIGCVSVLGQTDQFIRSMSTYCHVRLPTIMYGRITRIGHVPSSISLSNVQFSSQGHNDEDNQNQIQRCWRCDKPITASSSSNSDVSNEESYNTGNDTVPICEKCGSIQPISGDINFFTLFNLETRYDIDLTQLRQHYLRLQQNMHPDMNVNRSNTESDYSEDNSSIINGAYKTLRDPYQRGLYLLNKRYKMAIDEGNIETEPELLLEIMELNEDIELARNDKDDLMALLDRLEKDIESIVEQLKAAFADDNGSHARCLLVRYAYYNSSLDKLRSQLVNV